MVDKKRFLAPRGPPWGAEKASLWLSSLLKKKKKSIFFIFYFILFFISKHFKALWMPFLEAISRVLLSALPLARLLFAIELYDDGNVKVQRRIVPRPVPLPLWEGGFLKGEW